MKFLLAAVSFITLILLPLSAEALSSPQGITVSPAIVNVTAKPGQKSASFSLNLTNNTGSSVKVFIKTRDFTALGNMGQISLYGTNYDSKTNPHGLSYWMSQDRTQLGLAPGETNKVTININNIYQMAPGGHYGAVTFSVVAPQSRGQVSVSNNQVVSSLVFFQTADAGVQSLSLSSTSTPTFSFHPPNEAVFTLTDTGNTQTVPRGYVALYRGSSLISKSIINSASGLVLPGSSMLVNANLNSPKFSLLGGDYRLVVAYRPDSRSNFSYYQKKMFVVGIVWPILAVLVLAVFLTGLFKYKKRKRSRAKPSAPVVRRIQVQVQ